MTTQPPPRRPLALEELDPHMAAITQNVVFGDVWERKGLSKRDRSLITVAMLVALYRKDELRHHLRRALRNGVTREELALLIEHIAFYAGWPCAASGYETARQVFDRLDQRRT